METATGIIPDTWFEPRFKSHAITFLLGAPLPGKSKARILKDWAKWTGAKLTAGELAQIERSGVERAPEIKIPGA